MTVQLSIPVRNARQDAVETAIGTAAVLQIRSGAQPADCATAASGTLLATCNLPSDYLNNAANGSKTKLGTWSAVAAAAGNAGHFRLYDTAVANCGMQGNITATGGGGDMTVDNIVFASGQAFSVTTFTTTDANA